MYRLGGDDHLFRAARQSGRRWRDPIVPDSEAVAEAIRRFFRAHRTLRAYPVDNEISRRALAEAGERLGGVLPLTLQLFADRLESD